MKHQFYLKFYDYQKNFYHLKPSFVIINDCIDKK